MYCTKDNRDYYNVYKHQRYFVRAKGFTLQTHCKLIGTSLYDIKIHARSQKLDCCWFGLFAQRYFAQNTSYMYVEVNTVYTYKIMLLAMPLKILCLHLHVHVRTIFPSPGLCSVLSVAGSLQLLKNLCTCKAKDTVHHIPETAIQFNRDRSCTYDRSWDALNTNDRSIIMMVRVQRRL